MPNVFPAPPNLTLRFRVGRYMSDKLYLLSPVITPLEKENEDNLREEAVKTMFDVGNFSS